MLVEIWEFLYLKVGTLPFYNLFNDLHSLLHELVLNCVRRGIGSVKMVAST